MSRIRKASCLLPICLFLLAPAGFAQSEAAETGARLEWAAVDGARSYEIAVRAYGGIDILLTVGSETNSVLLPLAPGRYEVQITAINVFRRVFSTSAWSEFSIIRTAELLSQDLAGSELYAGASTGWLELTGTGFLPDTAAWLVSGRSRFEGQVRVSTDGSGLRADFNLEEAWVGSYDIVTQNPGLPPATLAGAARLLERVQPRITALSRTVLANNRAYPDLVITGVGFSAATVFMLRSADGTELRHSRLIAVSEQKVTVLFNLAEQPAGSYSLIAVNPGGLNDSLSTIVTVHDVLGGSADPHQAEESTDQAATTANQSDPSDSVLPAGTETATETGVATTIETSETADNTTADSENQTAATEGFDAPTDATTDVPAASRRLWLAAAWRPALVLPGDFSELFSSGLAGGDLTLGISFRSLFGAGSALGALGFELRFDPVYIPGADNSGPTQTSLTALGAATLLTFGWYPLLDGQLGFLAKAGYGLVVSALSRRTEAASEIILTQDSALLAGLSVRWEPGCLIVEAGADWQGVFYISTPAHLVRPYLRIGFWLD
ncbi:MAG: hypothetical protein A2087_07040 [Spirochaetes bacterium GWD1_61_31]|nr:MAG: hypothetical protein A2Y37_08430 [Spirochaetes bacterium GWB1_60_80]OHD28483.1 MAG: hypothetical protein A2004_14830 [Spirochaetes bacterium GWC1_61_12]OHD40100.1 MAG: hypothetical protein A2087_07040 [Spirochaetes bacterium GWD1_61_31]OHD45852.1 MAG: hypothetical protein A2Y35_04065 [Spirochaetes bacterium GWE1_60_18]OHD58395.1 MAG: hypothetical protein A2Y32_06455 [Spirochaetes bacterium GWF1_60_12]HAW85373.1 hypothetical protein [Spirochaetaceae bacterium]